MPVSSASLVCCSLGALSLCISECRAAHVRRLSRVRRTARYGSLSVCISECRAPQVERLSRERRTAHMTGASEAARRVHVEGELAALRGAHGAWCARTVLL